MKKEKHGDWPIALNVLTEEEARKIAHDVPQPPSRTQEVKHRRQEADERKLGHPADKHRLDDRNLD